MVVASADRSSCSIWEEAQDSQCIGWEEECHAEDLGQETNLHRADFQHSVSYCRYCSSSSYHSCPLYLPGAVLQDPAYVMTVLYHQ